MFRLLSISILGLVFSSTALTAWAFERNDLEQLKTTHNCPKCNLVGADLSPIRLLIEGANLEGANLRGANLTTVNLNGANLQNADLRGVFTNWEGLGYSVNLNGANMTGANLTGAKLKRASMRGANLQNTDLTGANLTGADLQGAILPKGSTQCK
jgi:uncharacterized protein YjbI with pentapeptide repeats